MTLPMPDEAPVTRAIGLERADEFISGELMFPVYHPATGSEIAYDAKPMTNRATCRPTQKRGS